MLVMVMESKVGAELAAADQLCYGLDEIAVRILVSVEIEASSCVLDQLHGLVLIVWARWVNAGVCFRASSPQSNDWLPSSHRHQNRSPGAGGGQGGWVKERNR